MEELRFDGRTAIVTGAGGNPSLGRSHALLLAERGANVVVNDIGRLPAGLGYEGEANAQAVVEEIQAAGGKAVASTNSVATQEGADAIVATALEAFGTVDILVNNAGICPVVAFEEMDPADFRQTIEVNLMGTVHTCRAAWGHMKATGYGRIVNISSGSMAGFAWQTAYAAAKGGVYSLTRALAAEGAEHGIKSNSVIPGALTRMVYAAQDEASSSFIAHARQNLPPEIVSPAVAFLAHESVPFTGECIESIGGHVARFYLARTPGFDDPAMTLETLADRWEDVFAGSPQGVSRHDDADPRDWSIKPYKPGWFETT
ncbi:SDR family NAD(P)-dependent oxidoreductase [Novosphingobium malaysiense]|uniref:SDR family NAD(P)-dependent oxidoreductase n=1 Tax=Novosphingobium malaysiense TaxID=1348853 RepID=UPI00068B842D|nr:SDR family NAD(P)-dependent oxidoreductase [Novosphingobium malaysiense]